MNCPDELLISDFVAGRVSFAVAREVGAHLDECGACRMLVTTAANMSLLAWTSSAPELEDRTVPSNPEAASRRIASVHPPFDSAPASSTAGVGQLLDGRFRLRRRLGRGAMGQVYAAYDERLNVQVALKLLLPEVVANHAYLNQLQREIVVARRVTHPNVCRVYDLGQSEDVHFISMELVDGDTVEARLSQDPPPVDAVVDMLMQITAALEAAHRCGVAHGDLKPSNIMVDAEGRVTVMDFGLAQDLRSESTHPSAPMGTPAYWAPEQARGEHATPASDLYSFGVIACRLFLWVPTTWRIHGDRLRAVPHAFRNVVARCLETDPANRIGSATELYAELAKARIETCSRVRSRAKAARIVVGAALFALATLGRPVQSGPPGLETLNDPRPATTDPLPPSPTLFAMEAASVSMASMESTPDEVVRPGQDPRYRYEGGLPVRPASIQDQKVSRIAAAHPRHPTEQRLETVDGVGYLTFDTYPWTRVSENGRYLGVTPLLRVPLSAGSHSLILDNGGQGIHETYRVTIREGDTVGRRLGLR